MASTGAKVLLHTSVYDLSLVENILMQKGYHIIKGHYFAEVMRILNGDDIVAGYAAVGREDASGIEFLRSLLEYNPVTQRVLLTSSDNNDLLKKSINRSHVNYILDYPAQQSEIEIYIRKINRRYNLLNRPFERYNALSEVTEDLLTQNERFREEASTDTLTKLFNRRAFDSFLKRYWQRYEQKKVSFSLALMDLDFFKKVNDTYGHTAGDIVLRTVANILRANERSGIDFIFRYGGEEFAIISASTAENEMEMNIGKLNKTLRETPIRISESQTLNITISAGICVTERALSMQSLIDNADMSLYQAKEQGRDRVVVYK